MKERYSSNLQRDEERMMIIAMITSFYNKNLKDETIVKRKTFLFITTNTILCRREKVKLKG